MDTSADNMYIELVKKLYSRDISLQEYDKMNTLLKENKSFEQFYEAILSNECQSPISYFDTELALKNFINRLDSDCK